MKIGIFGGSFNPPHKRHLDLGLELIEKGYVDKIIYVPTGNKYKYKTNLVEDIHRFRMLEIMSQEYDDILVSDYELKDEVIYTCDTLVYFSNLYKDDELYFICGDDNLSYVDEWKNGLDMLSKYKFIVLRRNGNLILELLEKYDKYRNNIIVADIKPYELSSTEIREKLMLGNDVSKLIDENVLKYIENNELYR